MDDEHSSRPPVGEPHEVDALEQLVGRLLDTCAEVLPLVAWWAISWLPSVPLRLTKADMASFDEQAAKAKAAILAYVETLA